MAVSGEMRGKETVQAIVSTRPSPLWDKRMVSTLVVRGELKMCVR